jgi:hypothetical protein
MFFDRCDTADATGTPPHLDDRKISVSVATLQIKPTGEVLALHAQKH